MQIGCLLKATERFFQKFLLAMKEGEGYNKGGMQENQKEAEVLLTSLATTEISDRFCALAILHVVIASKYILCPSWFDDELKKKHNPFFFFFFSMIIR